METLCALFIICNIKPTITGFPLQLDIMRSFGILLLVRTTRWKKQAWCQWLETPWRSRNVRLMTTVVHNYTAMVYVYSLPTLMIKYNFNGETLIIAYWPITIEHYYLFTFHHGLVNDMSYSYDYHEWNHWVLLCHINHGALPQSYKITLLVNWQCSFKLQFRGRITNYLM